MIPESVRHAAVHFVIALVAVIAYANSFGGVFQFDDYNVIVHNPVVHSWTAWIDDLGHGIRPLLKLSYLLNWLCGPGETGFHVFNIAVHVSCVFLVYHLSRVFLRRAVPAPGDPELPISLTAALLFAAHPANTEAITYISGRSSSLMTALYLSALLVHATAQGNTGSWRAQLATCGLTVLAVAVKETAATLPLAMLAWDLAAGIGWRQIVRRQWMSWLLLCALAILFLSLPGYAAMVLDSASLYATRGSSQLSAVAYLFSQWLWPVALNIDPDFGAIHVSLLVPVSCALLLVVAWRRHEVRRVLLLTALWSFATLFALHVFLPRPDVANERQLYLAAWPLCLSLSCILWTTLERRAAAGVALTLVLLLTGLTMQRNTVYRSEIALWQDTVSKSPRKARAHNNLGVAYMLAGRDAEAVSEFNIALGIDPAQAEARGNLEHLDQALQRPGD